MTNRIVVMGGSFNPPTIAHLKLMQAALDSVDACQGLFMPASQAYVARKMKKQRCQQDTMGEALRLVMLESLCKEDDRLAVSQVQLLSGEQGYDYEMLEAIQSEWSDAEIYFITGSDKLYILPLWHNIDELLARFRILVAVRTRGRPGKDQGCQALHRGALGRLHRV